MGKPTGKKKLHRGSKPNDGNVKQSKVSDRTSKAFDEDAAVFINMPQELKEEGNRLFQMRDAEGAMLKYEKAVKLLPQNHIDVASLRTNMAACYMELGLGEYPRAINECNLALEVAPKYSKALLKRAKCYEALDKLGLALRDIRFVLSMEPKNLTALEIEGKVKKALEEKGLTVEDKEIVSPPEYVEPPIGVSTKIKVWKDKPKKKKSNKLEKKKLEEVKDTNVNEVEDKKDKVDEVEDKKNKADKVEEKKKKFNKEKKNNIDEAEEKNAEEKVVVEEKISIKEGKKVTKTVKLVLGEDIRWAQMPLNSTIRLVRDIVLDRFPSLRGVLIKYRDQEGDLVTITTTAELRLAEASCDPQGSFRLYIVEVTPDKEPFYEGVKNEEGFQKVNSASENGNVGKSTELEKRSSCIEDWVIQFARLFKNHVGFDSDSYLDLHELGMKLYSEAMEETITSEDAQELFDIAGAKFQEMAALALFNWGNIHMNKARKLVFFAEEDDAKEAVLAQIKAGYEWAQKEYVKAGMRYEEALKIKPDFHEALLAVGQQQFEQAKLCWYYAIGTKTDLDTGPPAQVLELYNKAEDSMERGMQMWEEMEEQRLNGLLLSDKYKSDLQKMGLDGLFKDVSADDAAEQEGNMKSQIYILWGTLLYERSVVEFKLSLPTWEECLEVSVEKFELAGASPTDIAVIIKNHCSNGTTQEGLGFKIDEIVQAWNEMYDVKRWQTGAPSFRLEPLFRRRVPKLHSILEHV